MRNSVLVLAAVSAVLGGVTLALLWRALRAGQQPAGFRRLLWASTMCYALWVVLTIIGMVTERRVG